MTDDGGAPALPLAEPDESFPLHVWNAFGVTPRVLTEKIGGSVMVVAKTPPDQDEGGPVTVMTAGVGRLPVDGALPVELAVEVPPGQEGAALVALRIVANDVATRRRVPPVDTPWRNGTPFLSGTQIAAIVATTSRWGASFDEVRNPAGELVGHVRTLRLITDPEAAVMAAEGWAGLLARAGSIDALLDVQRTSTVPAPGGAPVTGAGNRAENTRNARNARPTGAASPVGGPPTPVNDAGATGTTDARSRMPVMLSRLHAQHPPRWLQLAPDGSFRSFTGAETAEYTADAANVEVTSLADYVRRFPWTEPFTLVARPGQTARYDDASGRYTLAD
ncbi:suppressor of fused protein SUFU [Salana multivorans]|uniref:Suppressor of fused protein SUFU n=1 Tax=Salana multivorans TaxID=120377 RepID=A0A3N2DBW3_9MICO|nr:suppressor of fused domain protein [Salana multivorans]ROR97280.1 suppressor of fused protein SUFU [Salana multivorans]